MCKFAVISKNDVSRLQGLASACGPRCLTLADIEEAGISYRQSPTADDAKRAAEQGGFVLEICEAERQSPTLKVAREVMGWLPRFLLAGPLSLVPARG